MTSIPQLRKDIQSLQAENRRLREELKAEKNKPVQVKEVVKEVPVQVIKTVEVPGPIKVVKEPAPPPRIVTKIIEKPVPGPVRYVDNPKHVDMIRKLQGRK